MTHARVLGFALVATALASAPVQSQPGRGTMPDSVRARRWAVENELQQIAVVDRKVMIPMRDGVRIAADIYYPKGGKKVPAIWVRTPYNFNYFDIHNGAPRDMSQVVNAIKRGYAWVDMQERGHFFSEGNYDILGAPISDGDDELNYLRTQSWSNGKIGTTGCSSTAEWQPAVASLGNPGFAAMNVQGFGAGVGRIGPYYEQGNWYRGGAVQMLFIDWLMGEQNQVRPMFPRGTTQQQLIEASKLFDLAEHAPPVDWAKAFWHLPTIDLIKNAGGPNGIFADSMPVPTGGAMMKRAPNDPAWYKGGLWHDNMPIDIPGLWFMSWYDVSVGPNVAMYNHVRKTGKQGDKQWMIIAPVAHCSYTRATEHTVVGERDMGDARLGYQDIMWDFFDTFLKDDGVNKMSSHPKVRYYVMGKNEWRTSDVWPPKDAQSLTFYLGSNGNANTARGDGTLSLKAPKKDTPDKFSYDPMNPVMSLGGNVCCQGNAVGAGAMDQSQKTEMRPDVLVYTTEPFKDGMELSGPITPTLYVSSDVKDTDFTVKVLDVYPDGKAYNLDESIQRMRYRDGYDKPVVWMEKDKVYKVTLQPLNTSNYFAPGHRLRIEVSSSNFPRFDRNMNTGGNNWDETKGVTANNVVHHSDKMPSTLTVTMVKAAVVP